MGTFSLPWELGQYAMETGAESHGGAYDIGSDAEGLANVPAPWRSLAAAAQPSFLPTTPPPPPPAPMPIWQQLLMGGMRVAAISTPVGRATLEANNQLLAAEQQRKSADRQGLNQLADMVEKFGQIPMGPRKDFFGTLLSKAYQAQTGQPIDPGFLSLTKKQDAEEATEMANYLRGLPAGYGVGLSGFDALLRRQPEKALDLVTKRLSLEKTAQEMQQNREWMGVTRQLMTIPGGSTQPTMPQPQGPEGITQTPMAVPGMPPATPPSAPSLGAMAPSGGLPGGGQAPSSLPPHAQPFLDALPEGTPRNPTALRADATGGAMQYRVPTSDVAPSGVPSPVPQETRQELLRQIDILGSLALQPGPRGEAAGRALHARQERLKYIDELAKQRFEQSTQAQHLSLDQQRTAIAQQNFEREKSDSLMRRQEIALDIAKKVREAGGVYTPTERTKMTKDLREAVRQEPSMKLWDYSRGGWQTAQEGHALNNAAGDLALINGINVLFQPTPNAVTMGEVTNVEQGQAKLQSLLNIPAKFFVGTRLTEPYRTQLYSLAQSLATRRATDAEAAIPQYYGRMAQQVGIPISDLFISPMAQMKQPAVALDESTKVIMNEIRRKAGLPLVP